MISTRRALSLAGARTSALALLGAAVQALPGSTGGVAQETGRRASSADAETGYAPGIEAEPWRFPVGERMEFSVTFGGIRLGEGSLAVEAVDTVWSRPAYRLAWEMSGGPPFYRVEDRHTSWVQPVPLASLRFDQNLHQGSYRRDRRYLLDPDELTYTRFDNVGGAYVADAREVGIPIPERALDEVSFLYLARLIPLEVGRTYEFDTYFQEEKNPVVLEVLRREEIRVPAGRFQTVVVRPIIKAGGMFGEGGEAEVYISDDDRRIIVRLKTWMKVGAGNLYLTRYEPGNREALIRPPWEEGR
jgi:hypothetical protein